MLQHTREIFFRIVQIDRKNENDSVPRIILDIFKHKEFIGQMQFYYDSKYSKNVKNIRMSFDLYKDITDDNMEIYGHIIVGGILWAKGQERQICEGFSKIFITLHELDETVQEQACVKSKCEEILKSVGAENNKQDIWQICLKNINFNYAYKFYK